MLSDDLARRLGRSILFVYQQERHVTAPRVRAELDTLFRTGRYIDFAVRLKEHGEGLTPELVREYALHAGVADRDLHQTLLPVLKQAGVIDYGVAVSGELTWVSEFVGIAASVIQQTLHVLEALGPTDAEMSLLHSVEVASWAPLTESQHLDQLTKRGLQDSMAQRGLKLAAAAGINQRVWSDQLNENVVFNPYVWGTKQIEIAQYLRSLPSAERDVLLGLCLGATTKPGLAVPQIQAGGVSAEVLTGARKVGLVQAATVKSSANPLASQTYVFSPLLEQVDDTVRTTEALHLRKLFVAHILFANEKALQGWGQVRSPVVLVNALLKRGSVGPATNIKHDYHMLEAHGIVRVEETSSGRGVLHMVKKEIVEDGLAWLRKTQSGEGGSVNTLLKPLQSPGSFVTPEGDRAAMPDDDATMEIMRSAILHLREEAARAARIDSPFS